MTASRSVPREFYREPRSVRDDLEYDVYDDYESSKNRRCPVPPRRHLARESAGRYRVRMRAQGLRQIQLWVPDTRSPKFAAECRRQSELVSRTPIGGIDDFLEAAAPEVEGWK